MKGVTVHPQTPRIHRATLVIEEVPGPRDRKSKKTCPRLHSPQRRDLGRKDAAGLLSQSRTGPGWPGVLDGAVIW